MLYKVQEWLANRVSWVQYPNVRPANDAARRHSRTGPAFTDRITVGQRIDIAAGSIALLVIGAVGMAAVFFLFYCLL